jgi:multiple sugar transport system permease protein
MISQSLKLRTDYYRYPFEWIPRMPTLANYVTLFRDSLILRWTLNSLAIAIGCALLQTLFCSMAGFGFARKRFRGRNAIFWFMMTQLMIPYQVTVIPIFLIMTRIKLIDTYFAFWLPFGVSVFGTFLMRQAFLGIPHDYDEAARIDGANDFQVYWRVLLPMSGPTVAVLAIFAFLDLWNDFLYALIMTQSETMKTLQVGLARLDPLGGEPGVLMAAAAYAFVPTFILFLTQQRRLVEGLQAGGLKG